MPQLPEKTQQILQAHAGLIHRVALACQNRELVPDLDQVLKLAEENEWVELVAAIRRILKGERDLAAFRHLDEEDLTIVEAILAGIQNPDRLPDLQQGFDAGLAAPGLASLIHGARGGNLEALQLIAGMAQQMLKAGGDMARLASIIRPLVQGERDADRLTEGFSAQGEKLVLDILRELGRLEGH
ncbi:hypothetical protein QVG61_02780 [Thiohalobacter sp. IOR34]|uniref:hypothetical protein n=1 Tax=Thiohalobacter sp. IOR34 TaxID=3057176 RepID=UPI0025B196D0|nr:hypothetical protein [Thiohalobacter sp. IOR34]WJW76034.1 hypothetical protein QVG61_02780 [Thiohalobacter sp. IOR34]